MICPTCTRAVSDDETTCQRCGTDIVVLRQLEERKDAAVATGRGYLRDGDAENAGLHFHKALGVSSTCHEARKGMALATLLQEEFRDALTWYCKIRNSSPHAMKRQCSEFRF